MGYWNQNEQGESFATPEQGEMVWGDQPADVMDDALDKIVEVFQRDTGRKPTKREVRAGLLFSLRGADLWEE